jgi:isoleucyl-tRNA synthetase
MVDHDRLDPALEASTALTRHVVSLGRAARALAGQRVRQPLRRAVVVVPPRSPELQRDDIAEELNVDEVVVSVTLSDALSVQLVPNFKQLGPRLGAATQHVRAALAAFAPPAAAAAAETLAAGGSITVELDSGPVDLAGDDVEVRTTPRQGFTAAAEGGLAVAHDLELDDGLLHRGVVREVVRQLQDLRKLAGLELSDRVEVCLEGFDDLAADADLIAREVLAVRLDFALPDGPASAISGGDGRDGRAAIRKA